MVNYWVVRAGRRTNNIEDIVLERGLIGIGWSDVGNLRSFNQEDIESLKSKVHEADPEERAGLGARILHRFAFEIVEGDLVLTPVRSTRTILIGIVTGDYQYDANPERNLLTNTRSVEWIRTDVTYDETPIPLNGQLTVWDANPYADRIESLIANELRARRFTTTSQAHATGETSVRVRLGMPSAREIRLGEDVTHYTLPDEWVSTERIPPEIDWQAANEKRAERTSGHQQLVQEFADAIGEVRRWVGVFDLALVTPSGIALAEMKTLSGADGDEIRQVRHAVGQLLYYEGLCLPDEFTDKPLVKAAVFNKQPSPQHTGWMEGLEIAVVWQCSSGRFVTTPESNQLLLSIGLPPFSTEEKG